MKFEMMKSISEVFDAAFIFSNGVHSYYSFFSLSQSMKGHWMETAKRENTHSDTVWVMTKRNSQGVCATHKDNISLTITPDTDTGSHTPNITTLRMFSGIEKEERKMDSHDHNVIRVQKAQARRDNTPHGPLRSRR